MASVRNAPTRYVRSNRVLWREHAGEVLVLVPGAEDALAIGQGGPALWEVLAEPVTVDEAASALAIRFDAPFDEVRSDIVGTIEELVNQGIVFEVGA